MFNDTLFKLDEIFTIDNTESEENIPDIYQAKLQLSEANTSHKETSFLDINIKVLDINILTSVYNKCLPYHYIPWLNCDVPRLLPHGINISQFVRFYTL